MASRRKGGVPMVLIIGSVLGMVYGVVVMLAMGNVGKRRVYWLLVMGVMGLSLLGFFAWKL